MRRIAHDLPRPRRSPPGIGIIGAGGIVEACHLPAYRAAGFSVAAIFDQDRVRAATLAERFAVPTVCPTLDALFEHPGVAVVDIAVPPQAMPAIAERAAAAGRHLLCQKPLGLTLADANRIADAVSAAGLKGAVNQQLRYAPAMRAAAALASEGAIGALRAVAFDVAVRTPWEDWPFWHGVADFELFGHSIHYLDAIRHLIGQPAYVFARTLPAPGRRLPGPIRNHIVLGYSGALHAAIAVDHDAPLPTDAWRAGFRIEGDDGALEGEMGALFDYPRGRPDRLRLLRRDGVCDFSLEGRWFPDAFAGTMGELMCAIEDDRAPADGVADGVATIALVEAVAASARTHRVVALAGEGTE